MHEVKREAQESRVMLRIPAEQEAMGLFMENLSLSWGREGKSLGDTEKSGMIQVALRVHS